MTGAVKRLSVGVGLLVGAGMAVPQAQAEEELPACNELACADLVCEPWPDSRCQEYSGACVSTKKCS